jgi:hypothetical protein
MDLSLNVQIPSGTRFGPYEVVDAIGPRPQVSLGEYPYDVSPDSQRFLVTFGYRSPKVVREFQ